MLKNKEYQTHDNIVKNIVKKSGGYREKISWKTHTLLKKAKHGTAATKC